MIEICEAEGIEIMKGVVSSDHVHLHIEYASKLNVSTILKKLKEHHESFNKNFQNWRNGIGDNISGQVVWSTGHITDEMVNEYLEHHRRDSSDNSNFILE